MKKVLVTGASGFIGNYVVEALLKKKYSVIATSLSAEKASTMPWFNQVKYIPFDLSKLDESVNYIEFFDNPDLVIHLAWEGLPNYKKDFHITENLPRHFSFLKNLIQHGLKDLTVTGTCFEYGMVEAALNESMETKPANAYAIAKDELRKKLQVLCELENVSLKWIRLFYMYGRGQSPNSLISQLDRALKEGHKIFNMSGGEQQRDFLPVEKVAENIVAIAEKPALNGIINCCSGKPQSVKDFVENYLKEQHKHIELNLGFYPYADYEPMFFWGDITKLKSILTNE